MLGLRRVWRILTRTGAIKIFISFLIFSCVVAFVLRFVEPQIETFGDGLWYCFVASTTIGFGDIYVITPIGRILTVIVAVYGIFVVAMVPGVVVSYYMEYLKMQEKETISVFLERLEKLPELSKDELKKLSERVRKMR